MRSFEDELAKLKNKIKEMGEAVGVLLQNALESLEKQDAPLAKKSIESDKHINLMEYEIENLVVRILALRQPVADDLRSTIIAIKVAADLERIGDLAKAIAKKVIATLGKGGIMSQQSQQFGEQLVHQILQMGQFAHEQLRQVLEAYENKSPEKAYQIWQDDAQLDTMNDTVFHTLMEQMGKDQEQVTTWTHFLFVAKSLERIGDHICNIAELINYQATGLWPIDEWTSHAQA